MSSDSDCPTCRARIEELLDEIAWLRGKMEMYDELLDEMEGDGVDVAGYKEDADIERRSR